MANKNVMQERIRRVKSLFNELHHTIEHADETAENFNAACITEQAFQYNIFIDTDSPFLEIAFTFLFSNNFSDCIRERLEELMYTLYEYGCYFSLHTNSEDIIYTVFSKIYYTGLNYDALRETIQDFQRAVECNRTTLETIIDTIEKS